MSKPGLVKANSSGVRQSAFAFDASPPYFQLSAFQFPLFIPPMDIKDTLDELEQWGIEVILHHKRGWKESAARVLVHGLSYVYAGLIWLRVKCYRERLFHDHHLGVPVISIGNLTV